MPAEPDMFDERSLLQQTAPKAGGPGDGSEQRAVLQRGRRRYCCVVNCHDDEGKDPNVRFYWFPGKPYEVERQNRRVRAVRRVK